MCFPTSGKPPSAPLQGPFPRGYSTAGKNSASSGLPRKLHGGAPISYFYMTCTTAFYSKIQFKKGAQPKHNPCTSGFSSFTSLSCGTRTTLCTSIYFGEMSFPNERSCTNHPPNPLHKPARVQYGLSCLELLRIALLLLCFLV